MGKLFIIVAPSGAGKTTLVERLLHNPAAGLCLEKIITYTTRDPRDGEVCGKDYFFISREEFEEKIKNNFFIEHSFVYNNYYGSSYESIKSQKKENILIAIFDFKGAQEVKRKTSNAVTIFIEPPTYNVLEQRILKRDADKNTIFLQARLAELKKEMNCLPSASFFDYSISQGLLEDMIFSLGKIIEEESGALKKDKK